MILPDLLSTYCSPNNILAILRKQDLLHVHIELICAESICCIVSFIVSSVNEKFSRFSKGKVVDPINKSPREAHPGLEETRGDSEWREAVRNKNNLGSHRI